MPHLLQPGAGEHSTHRSAAGLRDQTDNQPDERLEGGSGKARAKLGQETGQRARCGGAGGHRRITLTRTVNERSMLSSSPSKITDLAIPGASLRPADLAAPAKLRNTSVTCWCRELGHVMRPADTRVSGRRGGLVVAAERSLQAEGEWALQAPAVAAIGADGGCCSARRTHAAP